VPRRRRPALRPPDAAPHGQLARHAAGALRGRELVLRVVGVSGDVDADRGLSAPYGADRILPRHLSAGAAERAAGPLPRAPRPLPPPALLPSPLLDGRAARKSNRARRESARRPLPPGATEFPHSLVQRTKGRRGGIVMRRFTQGMVAIGTLALAVGAVPRLA